MAKNKDFDATDKEFMFKEYDGNIDAFDLHYKAVELTFNLYLVIVSAFIGVISFVYKENIGALNIFKLDNVSLTFVFIASICGLFLYFKLIEHRLLLITYVRALNSIRKWFVDNSKNNIEKYLVFPAKKNSPKYFRKRSHFYWESLSFGSITSTLNSILILNLLNKSVGTINNGINYIAFLVLFGMILLLHLLYYKKRASKREQLDGVED